ncbi:MAG: hypothetical protein N3E36_06755 [Sulfolobales archaeon]|nr:hypothetical protein [Sulfolobales archaeon]MCX8199700.1 hypothetical protein [Sulfolobales archaeon]MDW8170654.1 hypothetical protein [Desulfurococcaceae archaeon]
MLEAPLTHRVSARAYASFNDVVRIMESSYVCKHTHTEVINARPRVAVVFGERYFFRAGS